MQVLISFLGKSRKFVEGLGYEPAAYHFPDGRTVETSFFAQAALEHQRATGRKYDRLLLVGNAGSSWDDVAVRIGGLSVDDPIAVSLKAKADRETMASDDLDGLAKILTAQLDTKVECDQFGPCRTEEDARALIALLSGRVQTGDVIDIDITHSYRHLPLLTLMAGLTLEGIGTARIGKIWYGALEMSTVRKPISNPPVIELEGILVYSRWVRALAVYKASGQLAPLFELIAREAGDSLNVAEYARIDFLLETVRIAEAVEASKPIVAMLDTAQGAVINLFRAELQRQFLWVKQPTLAAQQAALARQYLGNGNLLRAALLGREAAVSRAIETLRLGDESQIRQPGFRRLVEDRVWAMINAAARDGTTEASRAKAYRTLLRLRNALAHVNEPEETDIARILTSHDMLANRLNQLFAHLF